MPLFAFAVIILLLLLIFVPGRLLYLHYTAYRKYQRAIISLFCCCTTTGSAGCFPVREKKLPDSSRRTCWICWNNAASPKWDHKKEADKLLLFLKQYKRNHR